MSTTNPEFEVTRLRDLYFPQGNEKGEYYEPYFKAETKEGVRGYGATPTQAIEDCTAKLNTVKS